MKKPTTDPGQSATQGARKDKQTLVLFLLGFSILFYSWLPLESSRHPVAYVLQQKSGTGQWQVVVQGLPATWVPRQEEINLISQEIKASYSFCETRGGIHLPASFALFCNQPLPINRCLREDLEMLPGIGPRLAAAILQTLEKKGQFTTPSDLLDVPGIGPRNLQRILPLVSFAQ